MSERTKEMFQLVDMIPESEQNFINEMIKRVFLAWDLTSQRLQMMKDNV